MIFNNLYRALLKEHDYVLIKNGKSIYRKHTNFICALKLHKQITEYVKMCMQT